MNREQKAATIDVLVTEIKGADAVFAVDYRGISVPQAAELRTKLREVDATFRVVKNSLTERAADQAGADALKALLNGPTALTFVRGDAAMAARAIADYARATQLLPFKGGLMEGLPLDAEQVRAISRLPSRDVLYSQLVGVVASPLTGLVRTLNALIGGLAVALGQVRDKKESGEIPAGEPPAAAASQSPAQEASPEAAPSATESSADEAPAAEAAPVAADEAPEAATATEEPAFSDELALAPEPPDAEPASEATAETPPDGEAAQQAAAAQAPAEELPEPPVSDEAPAGEAASEAAPETAVDPTRDAPAASGGEQAEPEGTAEQKDNQADASA